MPASATATGIHWQVSQATSLMNIVFKMSTASGNNHQGIWMENGSGGFMGDMVFNGGKFGMWVGNQQFTVRNVTVNNADTAIYQTWNWGWTWQGVTINNCQVGFDVATGAKTKDNQGAAAEAIIDAVVTNTPIFFRSALASNGVLDGSIVLNNIKLTNVPTAVGVVGGAVVLAGGTTTINTWGQGDVYTGTSGTPKFTQGSLTAIPKAASLLDSAGRIFGKTHPQYANYAPSEIISVKAAGAKGDGTTDDTAALKAIFAQYSGCKIIFFDAGTYIVTSTITIQLMVGEAWSVIMGAGSAFSNINSPTAVIRAGETNSQGLMEISDIVFSTRGTVCAGAIVVEWNVHDPSGNQGAAGMWDTHIRIGGAAGTNLQVAQCLKQSTDANCIGAWMGLHLTSASSAYLEGTWVWAADHDLEDNSATQLTIYSGRGIYSESQGPVWMIGTAAEHHALYNYQLWGAANHYIGLLQVETPYYQPSPAPPAPFTPVSSWNDPPFSVAGVNMAWGLRVRSVSNILVYGAGLYAFYQNYSEDCLDTFNCQTQIVDTDSTSSIRIYSLSTVASVYQLSVNAAGVIKNSDNRNGFAQTVTAWTQS